MLSGKARWLIIFAVGGCIDPLDANRTTDDLQGPPVVIGSYLNTTTVNTDGCTGTLISDDGQRTVILTAAHCVCGDRDALPTLCRKTRDGLIFNGERFPDAAAYVHPDYLINFPRTNDFRGSPNDAAVLVVPESLTLRGARLAPTRTNSLPHVGDLVALVGYGMTDGSDFCTVDPDGVERYGYTNLAAVVDKTNIHEGYQLWTQGAIHGCPGDSGGPMFDQSGNVLGVASFRHVEDPIFGDPVAQTVHWSIYDQQYWLDAATQPGQRIRILQVAQPATLKECEALCRPDTGTCSTDPNQTCGSADDCPRPVRPGCPPTQSVYTDRSPDGIMVGWLDEVDEQVVGDFAARGYDQMLMINRGPIGQGIAFIGNWRDGFGNTESNYYEVTGQSGLLNGWIDRNDWLLAGDFMHDGDSQAMFINRSGTLGEGRVLIADFSHGVAPANTRYRENYGQTGLLTGWIDDDDVVVAGDFRHRGYSQALFVNRTSGAADRNEGRVLIADFSDGVAPAEILFWENYNATTELDQLTDPGDIVLVGDFMGLGWDQVMFINTDPAAPVGAKHVVILDFNGVPRDGPARVRYSENYGDRGTFVGWHDPEDIQLVGDFTGHTISGTATGHPAQVMFINNTLTGDGPGYIEVVYFYSGTPDVQWYESLSEATVDPNLSRLNASQLTNRFNKHLSVVTAGDFRNYGRTQVMAALRDNRPPVASVSPRIVSYPGNPVTPDGSRSYDPDGDTITYQWSLSAPTGSTATFDFPQSPTPSFTPDVLGRYQAVLVVKDDRGATSTPAVTTIDVIPPTMFAQSQLTDAAMLVQELPDTSVTSPGNRTALDALIQSASTTIQQGNLTGARKLIGLAITRTDGWVLRGAPDTAGAGRDWVLERTASTTLYHSLVTALAAVSL